MLLVLSLQRSNARFATQHQQCLHDGSASVHQAASCDMHDSAMWGVGTCVCGVRTASNNMANACDMNTAHTHRPNCEVNPPPDIYINSILATDMTHVSCVTTAAQANLPT